MEDEIIAAKELWKNTDVHSLKRQKTKKESFLLKFQLFMVIYQKKGPQNFSEIVNKIKMAEYGFAYDICNNINERCFTFIVKGFVMVFVQKADDPSSPPVLYKKMGSNEHFGEKAVFGNGMKFHSAKSVSNTVVFELDLETFYKAFSGHFKYHELKEKVEFLSSIWMFKEIREIDIERILLLSKPFKYVKNTILFKEGERPSAVYIVIEGELTLLKKDSENGLKYQPFMIIGKGEICSFEEVLSRTVLPYGGIVTSSFAVFLKISCELFIDIFGHKINGSIVAERNKIKENLIEVKSKKCVTTYLKKLNEKNDKGSIKKLSRLSRYRSFTNPSEKKNTTDIFEFTNSNISRENILKNKGLREAALSEIKKNIYKKSAALRLSTATNFSFSNEKELLLDYLAKKERREREEEESEEAFRGVNFHPIPMLAPDASIAVKNQKRKLKHSRKKNFSSTPSLN